MCLLFYELVKCINFIKKSNIVNTSWFKSYKFWEKIKSDFEKID